MDNIKVLFENNNFLIFLIVLVAIMGVYVLVGNVIKTTRDLRKPYGNVSEDIKKLKAVVDTHTDEIQDIRRTNRIQCQAVRALLNHAIHNGNTEEMQRAAGALDEYLTDKI